MYIKYSGCTRQKNSVYFIFGINNTHLERVMCLVMSNPGSFTLSLPLFSTSSVELILKVRGFTVIENTCPNIQVSILMVTRVFPSRSRFSVTGVPPGPSVDGSTKRDRSKLDDEFPL